MGSTLVLLRLVDEFVDLLAFLLVQLLVVDRLIRHFMN